MFEMSLLDMVLMITGALVTMAFLCCLYCVCMKLSDYKMKRYIIKMADKTGVEVNLDKLDPNYKGQSPLSNENCTIIVPDVGIII